MPRGIKIAIGALAIGTVLAIAIIIALFVAIPDFKPTQIARREIRLPNHGSLVIDGKQSSRSEHGFSQRAGYRPPGSTKIEWFGDVSDGVEPQVYEAGPLLVVIDLPSAQLFVRTHAIHTEMNQDATRGDRHTNPDRSPTPIVWKSLALIFPNDLGPFPISFYAERNGLTAAEVSQINLLGGKRERKYPTTYIQSFDPKTRELHCSYQVDNTNSWPLHLRLSDDGTHLALIGIGASSR